MRYERSKKLFSESQLYIPGGVNSPARAFGPVGGSPVIIRRANRSRVYDVDGNEYVDYVCSWGPLILGHSHPSVIAAIRKESEFGTSFGAPTLNELKMAALVCRCVPSVEMVRMVNSGTEATMSAIRLARGFTGRDLIIKFEGCWHGHGDAFLIKTGSSALSQGVPDSPGVPDEVARLSVTVPYNDLEAVKSVLRENPGKVAAIIVEPVAGNMGVVPPGDGFLDGLRSLATSSGTLLIFDEVITGFRVSLGGAQSLYDVMPDLTCMGKIIGGGLPVGAYGGRLDIMQNVSPLGMKVSQAGTLSGNPIAMVAGYTTLLRLCGEDVYADLEATAEKLTSGMMSIAKSNGYPVCIQRVGSMFTLFFHPGPVRNYDDAAKCDTERFARYFHSMLDQGIYLPPSQFESWFVSHAHTEKDVALTLKAHEKALKEAFA
ncbi:MAG TPA: glutamate-1-semialdehyde 2,1-aminomutase [Candidatus Brocadiia bacterium]|nr:glutamate-1-semialdehyde 2,1-aminomutase [Candidatus Brocadiia bacterium]